jgi:hypothetical protein
MYLHKFFQLSRNSKKEISNFKILSLVLDN